MMVATALYELGELHKDEDAANVLKRAIDAQSAILSCDELQVRRQRWQTSIESALGDIALRQRRAQTNSKDVLDRPVLRVLQSVLEQDYTRAAATGGVGYKLT